MDADFLGRCERCGLLHPEETLASVNYNGVEEYWDEGCITIARENGEEVEVID